MKDVYVKTYIKKDVCSFIKKKKKTMINLLPCEACKVDSTY